MVSFKSKGCAFWYPGGSGIYKNEKALCGPVPSVDGPFRRNTDIFRNTEYGDKRKHFLPGWIDASVFDVYSCLSGTDMVQLVLSAESLEQAENSFCCADGFHGNDNGNLYKSNPGSLAYCGVVRNLLNRKAGVLTKERLLCQRSGFL